MEHYFEDEVWGTAQHRKKSLHIFMTILLIYWI